MDISPYLTEVLRDLYRNAKKKALKTAQPMSEYVFVNNKDKVLRIHALHYALHRCLEKAQLRGVRFHDLRHSYATIRLMRGHNIGDVSRQLGHSSISITYDKYCHWIPGSFKNEVDELDSPHLNAPQVHPDRMKVVK